MTHTEVNAGIGRATARLSGQRGASVALVAWGSTGLHAAARLVEHAGGKALPIPAHMAAASASETATDAAESQFGPIDVWINVAFTSAFAPFTKIVTEEFRRITEVSYLGSVYALAAAAVLGRGLAGLARAR